MVSSSFVDRRDSYPGSISSCSMSAEDSFNASFSSMSSVNSFNGLPTPQRDLADPFDEMAFSQGSFRSHTHSPCEMNYNSMTSVTQDMLLGMSDNMLYATPSKNTMGNGMMSYDFSYDIYKSPESQGYMSDMPPLHYDYSSPLAGTPSPSYVVPTHTFLESMEPSTPTPISKMSLNSSPLSSVYGSHGHSGLKYFLTPPQHRPSPCSSSQSTYSPSPRRMVPSMAVHESSAMLHRIQGSSRVRKTENKGRGINVNIVPGGQFRCDFPGCKSEHAFKRQEHLKRHKKTHTAEKDLQCRFCPKKFQADRSDNYRSHVKLHARYKKGTRTKYFPEAAEEVKSWGKEHRSSSDQEDEEEESVTSPRCSTSSSKRNGHSVMGAEFS